MARNRPIAGLRARANGTDRSAGSAGDAGTGASAGSAGDLGTGASAGSAGDAGRDAGASGRTGTKVLEPPVAERREEDSGAAAGERTIASRSGTRLLAGLMALTLSSLAAFGLVAYRVRGDQMVETARDQAAAAAHDNAEVILSYDYRHLDANFAAARATLTGGFARDYKVTTTKLVRPGAEQYHVVVKAEVASQSVVSASAHQVVVLLFVNQTTTSTRLDGPRVDLNRVRLTLVKVDGRWLVNKVVAL
jgi:Mce-associated membrane protein